MAKSIQERFEGMPDPRRAQGKRHLLSELITVTILAVVCGADSWEEVEDFGQAKQNWLKEFLDLPHGIASHDTFARVFARLDPQALEQCLLDWMADLAEARPGRLVALDGKRLRHSYDRRDDRSAIHMVSAWCQDNRLVLGQLACEAKENEITAMPKLLGLLDLKDAVVTTDAMGCQKKIARKIRQQGGDYLLQVKDNHPTLHEQLRVTLDEAIALGFTGMQHDFAQTVDAGHGRIETRRLWCTSDLDWVPEREAWADLASVVVVESVREVDGQSQWQRRYFISSLPATDAERLLAAVRGHWSVENQLHWSLDVTFGEDASRVRQGYAAENLGRFRRVGLGLLKREKTFKGGIHRKRLRCAMDHDYLLKVLGV